MQGTLMKILLSIKPQYAESILDGSKRFEFRKRIHSDSRVKTIVIYATMPVGKVIGEFVIAEIHSDNPALLWEKTKEFSGISRSFFIEYFQNKEIGYAIEVKSVKRYKTPKSIKNFLPNGVPPQSYVYLT